MEYLYAQLDEDGVCMALSQLAGEVIAPDMVRLTTDEYQCGTLMGKRYQGGEWVEVEADAIRAITGGVDL